MYKRRKQVLVSKNLGISLCGYAIYIYFVLIATPGLCAGNSQQRVWKSLSMHQLTWMTE